MFSFSSAIRPLCLRRPILHASSIKREEILAQLLGILKPSFSFLEVLGLIEALLEGSFSNLNIFIGLKPPLLLKICHSNRTSLPVALKIGAPLQKSCAPGKNLCAPDSQSLTSFVQMASSPKPKPKTPFTREDWIWFFTEYNKNPQEETFNKAMKVLTRKNRPKMTFGSFRNKNSQYKKDPINW